MRKIAANSLIALLALGAQASAVTLLSAGDPILGGVLNGANFEVGVVGTSGGVNNWPGAELPEDLINGVIGGGGEKYLNFAKLNTGFIVTPTGATGGLPTILNSMELWVANDAPERDPASFSVFGTNSVISGAGPFAIADFTLILSGALSLPDTRDTVADSSGFSQVVPIGAAQAYTSYLVVFPTVKDELAANSMQLSEIQFDGAIVPEPSAALLALFGGLLFLRRRR